MMFISEILQKTGLTAVPTDVSILQKVKASVRAPLIIQVARMSLCVDLNSDQTITHGESILTNRLIPLQSAQQTFYATQAIRVHVMFNMTIFMFYKSKCATETPFYYYNNYTCNVAPATDLQHTMPFDIKQQQMDQP